MSVTPFLPAINVEQRFLDATRVGRPEWVWFEVSEARWAEAVATIQIVLQEVLAFGRSDDKLIDDPVALSIACYTSGTGPLLGSWVEGGNLTTTAANAEVLRVHLVHNRVRMTRLTERTSEAVEALSAGGVKPTAMKGMHTAHHYFDEPGQRIASDIDLLLRPNEMPIAAEILGALGYRAGKSGFGQRSWVTAGVTTKPVTLTYVHRDDPWSIDLHENATRKLAGGSRMADVDALVTAVPLEPWRISPRAAVFPPALLLVQLLVHASCSFESLTLQRQYEISIVIAKNGGREAFDWQSFTKLCDRAELWPFLYPALRCVDHLSPNLIPGSIMIRSREAAPHKVRKLIETHSAASAHRVGRWSWAERYMWADGVRPRVRQFLDELRTQDNMNFAEVAGIWKMRVYRQLGRAHLFRSSRIS